MECSRKTIDCQLFIRNAIALRSRNDVYLGIRTIYETSGRIISTPKRLPAIMANIPSRQLTTFLSITKTTIYLGLIIAGAIMKCVDQPSSVFILGGLGLFTGHVFYRTIAFKEKQTLKIVVALLTTLSVSTIVILFFNIPAQQ